MQVTMKKMLNRNYVSSHHQLTPYLRSQMSTIGIESKQKKSMRYSRKEGWSIHEISLCILKQVANKHRIKQY